MAVRLLCVCLLSFHQLFAQEIDLTLQWQQERATAVVVNQRIADLQVKLHGVDRPIAGGLALEQTVTRFTPAIPFTNGLTYVLFSGHDSLCAFAPDLDRFSSPEVIGIFPRSDQVPENLLKLYIQFDQPMEVGKVYDYVHLYHKGQEVENALIRLDPELWNARGDVLTIWIDPGRVKRGLEPNKRFGQVLESGRTYRLMLEKEFRSRAGKQLTASIYKEFLVLNRDTLPPAREDIQLEVPGAGTSDPLTLQFRSPMDYSLHTMVQVYAAQQLQDGNWEMVDDRTLVFKPDMQWKEGSYRIEISSEAEDLAGNNFYRLFDVDLQADVAAADKSPVLVEFELR